MNYLAHVRGDIGKLFGPNSVVDAIQDQNVDMEGESESPDPPVVHTDGVTSGTNSGLNSPVDLRKSTTDPRIRKIDGVPHSVGSMGPVKGGFADNNIVRPGNSTKFPICDGLSNLHPMTGNPNVFPDKYIPIFESSLQKLEHFKKILDDPVKNKFGDTKSALMRPLLEEVMSDMNECLGKIPTAGRANPVVGVASVDGANGDGAGSASETIPTTRRKSSMVRDLRQEICGADDRGSNEKSNSKLEDLSTEAKSALAGEATVAIPVVSPTSDVAAVDDVAPTAPVAAVFPAAPVAAVVPTMVRRGSPVPIRRGSPVPKTKRSSANEMMSPPRRNELGSPLPKRKEAADDILKNLRKLNEEFGTVPGTNQFGANPSSKSVPTFADMIVSNSMRTSTSMTTARNSSTIRYSGTMVDSGTSSETVSTPMLQLIIPPVKSNDLLVNGGESPTFGDTSNFGDASNSQYFDALSQSGISQIAVESPLDNSIGTLGHTKIPSAKSLFDRMFRSEKDLPGASTNGLSSGSMAVVTASQRKAVDKTIFYDEVSEVSVNSKKQGRKGKVKKAEKKSRKATSEVDKRSRGTAKKVKKSDKHPALRGLGTIMPSKLDGKEGQFIDLGKASALDRCIPLFQRIEQGDFYDVEEGDAIDGDSQFSFRNTSFRNVFAEESESDDNSSSSDSDVDKEVDHDVNDKKEVDIHTSVELDPKKTFFKPLNKTLNRSGGITNFAGLNEASFRNLDSESEANGASSSRNKSTTTVMKTMAMKSMKTVRKIEKK